MPVVGVVPVLKAVPVLGVMPECGAAGVLLLIDYCCSTGCSRAQKSCQDGIASLQALPRSRESSESPNSGMAQRLLAL